MRSVATRTRPVTKNALKIRIIANLEPDSAWFHGRCATAASPLC